MSIRKTVFLTIICLAATVSFAFAQGAGPAASAKKTCPPYDDGKKGDATPIVDAIDADKDGKMTRAEWEKAGAPIESFQSFTGKSRKDFVSRQEFMDETPPDGVDADCDGKFTIKEFHDFGLQGPPGGGAPGGAPQAGGAPGGAPPAQK